MSLENLKGHYGQGFLMGGGQDKLWRSPGIQGLFPARRTKAPLVPGPQACKAVFRAWGGQVIAAGRGKGEELGGHDGADGMKPCIFRARLAAAISEKAGEGVERAGDQLFAQHVPCIRIKSNGHGTILGGLAHKPPCLNRRLERMIARLILILTLCVGASPVLAQEVDPIGALLDRPAAAAPQPAPAVQAPVLTPPAVQEPLPAVVSPDRPRFVPLTPAPAPVRPPPARTQVQDPVMIDELDRTPEPPLTTTDLNYESRLRASIASAQGLQGPLDGRWVMRTASGAQIYSLQLVDTGMGRLEGAWRDLRRPGALDASGFVDEIRRAGAQLYVRFETGGGHQATSAQLDPRADGSWEGELYDDGHRHKVILKRD